MNSIIIVGTGLAGYNLAKEIRKHDKQCQLTLITADSGESYSKPMLSNAIGKQKSVQQLVLASAEQMATQLNATVLTNTRVQSFDASARTLTTTNGSFSYTSLVLAVGASQIPPPLQGDAVDEIVSINDLEDYARFRERFNHANRIAIIGPGLIGCEFANDICSSGKSVTVIGPGQTPLERLLPTEAGSLLKRALSEKGVQWQLGKTVVAVNKADSGYQLQLSDNTRIEANLVLSAIGLKPNIQLAAQAGAQVNRGIVVDRLLKTSLDNVYALGDCAEIAGMVMPFVLPLMNSARTLAKTLTGTPTEIRFPAMPVIVKTPAHPIVVSSPPASTQGEWQVEWDDNGARALFHDTRNALCGFVLTGDKIDEKPALSKQLPPVLN